MRIPRWLIILAAIFVVLLIAKNRLLDTAASPGQPFAIDLAALHRAALTGAPLPTRIDVERIADFSFPRTIVVAGAGLGMQPMVLLSHRVVWPDHSVIVDTALGPSDAKSLPGTTFHRAAYDRMEQALLKAQSIVFTHEHVDHVGGVGSAPNFSAIASKVQMTREQFDGPKLDREQFASSKLAQLKLLEYNGLYAVAPGIVLQKAPGHTPGSQLIYVELASGARYLFVGDIAWSEDNIRLQRGRPGLAELLMKEDRPAVAAELAAIAALPSDLHVVAAHDPHALQRDLSAGLFHEGFGD
jgi:glyoxylase-like metal-dependent hydrolase (beta-lactamase superfamily II)